METMTDDTKKYLAQRQDRKRHQFFNLCLFLTGCVLWFGWGMHTVHLHGQFIAMGHDFYDLEHSHASAGMVDFFANAMGKQALLDIIGLTVQAVCLIPLTLSTIALFYLGLSEKVRDNVQGLFEASDRGDFTEKEIRKYSIYAAVGSMILSLVTGGYIQTGLYLAVFTSLSVYSTLKRGKAIVS